MKSKFIDYYMRVAESTAKLSYAKRTQIGCVIVKDDTVIFGYNGTPPGDSNVCEEKIIIPSREWYSKKRTEITQLINYGYQYDVENDYWWALETKPEVRHAEFNAILKLARSNQNSVGSSMFCTHSPCYNCATLIATSGIKEVFYKHDYRISDGIKYLIKHGILVNKVE